MACVCSRNVFYEREYITRVDDMDGPLKYNFLGQIRYLKILNIRLN